MSILIKGMKMPQNCWMCPLSVLYEKPRELLRCKITKKEVLRGNIDNNCPLIEVQKHGRLIDADALRLLYDFNGYEPTGDMTEEEFDRLMCRLPVIRQNIDDMPTIIEADDSVKHGKWIPYKTRRTHKNWWQCSLCGFVSEHKVNHNFCPQCGAEMKDDDAPTIIEAEGNDGKV